MHHQPKNGTEGDQQQQTRERGLSCCLEVETFRVGGSLQYQQPIKRGKLKVAFGKPNIVRKRTTVVNSFNFASALEAIASDERCSQARVNLGLLGPRVLVSFRGLNAGLCAVAGWQKETKRAPLTMIPLIMHQQKNAKVLLHPPHLPRKNQI